MASSLFVSQGGGEGFEWDPEGVTFAHDYTTDRRFDGEAVTSDFSVDLAGGFDADDVTELGMAVFNENTNRPAAAGDLFTLLQTLDYTVVFFWRQQQISGYHPLALLWDINELGQVEIVLNGADTWATYRDGSYNDVGEARAFSDNVLAVSFNAEGLLASLNGATAVLTEPASAFAMTLATIGHDNSSSELEGWLKALIFYPPTNAAGVEAYAANAAPVNSVAPVISGTAQVGQTLSVSTGTWSGSPTSYEYQWYRDNFNSNSAVVGATANTFVPTGAEIGVVMKCVVYALNADGISGIAVSDDETVVAA